MCAAKIWVLHFPNRIRTAYFHAKANHLPLTMTGQYRPWRFDLSCVLSGHQVQMSIHEGAPAEHKVLVLTY
jgi:hypothetical protein